ncbi:uncharacterized protein EAF02_004166 [Botrytis sinoallii]|uniref:uncharacterized protein n=1 Tax=Botrytis sinoallii TaxID=1463999 RepID=UPI001902532E|nr:uncharacterized protein EAF02_004166 [Botrytis sinoallii]KAF7885657.1 hypothetical protein EAF02_004166 [Botrytis sinoallii]
MDLRSPDIFYTRIQHYISIQEALTLQYKVFVCVRYRDLFDHRLLHIMIVNLTNRMLDHVLRVLQLIFAIIVMGTDDYTIRLFRGHIVYEHFDFGSFYDYYGVPDSWGFLMIKFHDGVLIGYIHVAVETVAVLSWLAGFIAVAVQIPTDTCSTGRNSCTILIVATVFGALEFLLFMITAALTAIPIFKQFLKPKTSTTGPDTVI